MSKSAAGENSFHSSSDSYISENESSNQNVAEIIRDDNDMVEIYHQVDNVSSNYLSNGEHSIDDDDINVGNELQVGSDSDNFTAVDYTGKEFLIPFRGKVYYIMIVTSMKNKSSLNGLGDNIELVDIDSCDYAVATLTRTSNNLIINGGGTASVGIILYGLVKTNDDLTVTGFGFNLGIEFDIDGCMSNPCHNDASCLNGVYSYICHCSGKFTGRLCDTPLVVDPSPTTTFDQHVLTVTDNEKFDTTSTVKSLGKDSGENRPPSVTSLMASTPQPESDDAMLQTRITEFSQQLEPNPVQDSTESNNRPPSGTSLMASTPQTESDDVMLQTRITEFSQQLEPSPVQDSTEWNTPPLNSEEGNLASLSVAQSLGSECPTPWTSTTTLPGSSTTRVCRCSCRGQGTQTKESASQYAEETRMNLTVEMATLRKTMSKRVTVKDGRSSAHAIGWIAILMVLVPVAFFVISDIFSLCIHIRELYVGIENN
ncbi:uncharacterized protein LOC121374449 [Gigantopelta aegis]|uniref:uncharacterized protein LOC121374449 n=1 Tax=Gigantopelta aegis TaxID=1735272 RepID=UPI001B8894AE|nr:uncharacterized protein LOC121374449 [Gigantopelta aegis]